jgi:hypothetical protein
MIDSYTINYVSPRSISLTFTGASGGTVYIEVDGIVIDRPIETTGIPQSETLTVDDASAPHAIAIHETDTAPEPIYTARDKWTRPVIQWQAKFDAVLYRIYRGTKIVKQIRPIADLEFYEFKIFDPLSDGWHTFRVEAVDTYGRETTRTVWAFRVFAMPNGPDAITAAQDETTLTITVDHE